MTTYYNPSGLELGQRIRIRCLCTVGYESYDRERQIHKGPICSPPMEVVVCGVVKKALGQYHPAVHLDDMDGGYGETAYLAVSKYVWLYECRTTLKEKAFLVHPEDVVDGNARIQARTRLQTHRRMSHGI